MSRFIWGSLTLLVLMNLQITIAQFEDFDLGFDNPLSNIWNSNRNNINVIPDIRRSCTVGTTGREGNCMNAAACRFQRGKIEGRGTCSFWNTCCVFEKTANQTTTSRVSYFVHTSGARQLPQAQKLYVKLANRNVCQMRVDIIDLNILPPSPIPPAGATSRVCDKDYLKIDPSPSTYRIPLICGQNKNTHFYVHLDATQMTNNGIIMSVLLDTTSTAAASWDIKITQLECPGNRNLLDLHNHKDNRNQVVSDFEQLAPARCLQYFTERTGSFSNFGFVSDELSTMSTDQDYAVCFKSLENSCGVTLTTATALNLRATSPACTEESVYVPELKDNAGADVPGSKLCAGSATPVVYTSKHPGPLYAHVNSLDPVMAEVPPAMYGFKFNFENNIPCP